VEAVSPIVRRDRGDTSLIVLSYCHSCEKMRRFKVFAWDQAACGPALVPVEHGSKEMLYTPETAEGWKVDGRCLRQGCVKRMVLPRALVERLRVHDHTP